MSYREDLKEKYPELFDQCFDFSTGDGWGRLITELVLRIAFRIESIHSDLELGKRFLSNPSKYTNVEYWTKKVEEYQALVDRWKESPVKIVQIKEKFGTLSFYTHNTTPEMDAWIRFAEGFSIEICEGCGNPSTVMTTGWIKHYCEPCASENELDFVYRKDA